MVYSIRYSRPLGQGLFASYHDGGAAPAVGGHVPDQDGNFPLVGHFVERVHAARLDLGDGFQRVSGGHTGSLPRQLPKSQVYGS